MAGRHVAYSSSETNIEHCEGRRDLMHPMHALGMLRWKFRNPLRFFYRIRRRPISSRLAFDSGGFVLCSVTA